MLCDGVHFCGGVGALVAQQLFSVVHHHTQLCECECEYDFVCVCVCVCGSYRVCWSRKRTCDTTGTRVPVPAACCECFCCCCVKHTQHSAIVRATAYDCERFWDERNSTIIIAVQQSRQLTRGCVAVTTEHSAQTQNACGHIENLLGVNVETHSLTHNGQASLSDCVSRCVCERARVI